MRVATIVLAAVAALVAQGATGQAPGSGPAAPSASASGGASPSATGGASLSAGGGASAPASSAVGNANAAALGATLATQGAPGVAPCSSCHGAQGEGQAAAGFPRLAGQPAPYLQRQLQAYAEDYRTNPIMQPIAKAMTPEQRAAAASHYASIVPPAETAAAKPAAAPPLGRTLATVGAQDRNLQACANCHGPEGIGEWATYPALAGQHATYLKNALAAWKDGSRRTDPSEQMPRIARLLSSAETDAVVAYFASLPPARPMQATSTANAASRTTQTIVSGPTTGNRSAPAQGTGTEQGAPVSGGTQGVGGPGNPAGPQSGAANVPSGPGAASEPPRR